MVVSKPSIAIRANLLGETRIETSITGKEQAHLRENTERGAALLLVCRISLRLSLIRFGGLTFIRL